MNVFEIFVSFAQYLGTIKALIMVVAFYGGDFILKKLPAVLDESAQSGNKLANFLLYDFRTKRCPVIFE